MVDWAVNSKQRLKVSKIHTLTRTLVPQREMRTDKGLFLLDTRLLGHVDALGPVFLALGCQSFLLLVLVHAINLNWLFFLLI